MYCLGPSRLREPYIEITFVLCPPFLSAARVILWLGKHSWCDPDKASCPPQGSSLRLQLTELWGTQEAEQATAAGSSEGLSASYGDAPVTTAAPAPAPQAAEVTLCTPAAAAAGATVIWPENRDVSPFTAVAYDNAVADELVTVFH